MMAFIQPPAAPILRSLRKIFPKLVRMDGEALPPLILFDIEGTANVPETLGSFYLTNEARNVAVQFIEQYYTMYDSDNRNGLTDAYHETAMFALAVHRRGNSNLNLVEYIRIGRNLLRVAEADRRLRFLYRGKLDIVACLQRLPPTQHDAASLAVDVCVATPSIMTITTSGIFKELTSKTVGDLKAFSRTFVLVPHGSGFNIVNETFLVTNATSEQARKAFKKLPTSPSSPVPPSVVSSSVLSATATTQQTLRQQMELVAFCQQSGMNGDWAMKCLEDNNWDFEKAARVFREMNALGSIPREAFLH